MVTCGSLPGDPTQQQGASPSKDRSQHLRGQAPRHHTPGLPDRESRWAENQFSFPILTWAGVTCSPLEQTLTRGEWERAASLGDPADGPGALGHGHMYRTHCCCTAEKMHKCFLLDASSPWQRSRVKVGSGGCAVCCAAGRAPGSSNTQLTCFAAR